MLTRVALVLLGAIILLSYAFLNRYVLLHFGDTHKYIQYIAEWNHKGGMFSFFYSLFIGATSLGASLWLTAGCQAMGMSAVLYAAQKHLLRQEPNAPLFLGTLVLLAYCTSLSRVTSTIMPDVFAPMLCLLLFLLFSAPRGRAAHLAGFMLAIGGLMHTSFWSVLVVFGAVGLPILYRLNLVDAKRLGAAAAWCLAPLALIPLLHLALFHKAYISKTSHIMLISRMAENGTLDAYLDKYCTRYPSTLCQYKGQYSSVGKFLFDLPYSPLYKVNPLPYWEDTWEDPMVKKEFDAIILRSLTDPDLLLRHAQEAGESTFKTLLNNAYYADSDPFPLFEGMLMQGLPRDLQDYRNSMQFKGDLQTIYDGNLVERYSLAVVLALLGLLALAASWKQWPPALQTAFVVAAVYIPVHAFICGTFSGALPRYADRVNWLVVWLAMMAAAHVAPRWWKGFSRQRHL